jgi:hypothetical protein
LEQARELYLEIWSQHRTYDTALNLAQIAYANGDYVAAAEYARFGLEEFPPSERPALQKHFKDIQRNARGQIATVKIEAPAGTEVRVDGNAVGNAPVGEVYVEAGTHQFAATISGEEVAKAMTVSKGEVVAVSLNLHSNGSDGVGEPVSDGGTESQRGKPLLVPIVAGGVVAAVGIGVGVGFAVSAKNKRSDAEDLEDEIAGSNQACGAGTPVTGDCARLDELWNDRDRVRDVAIASFALAGTAVAATLGYAFWPRPGRESTVWVSPTINGLRLEGRF